MQNLKTKLCDLCCCFVRWTFVKREIDETQRKWQFVQITNGFHSEFDDGNMMILWGQFASFFDLFFF